MELHIGAVRLEHGDVFPVDDAGAFAAELHAFKAVHAHQHRRQLLHVLTLRIAQIEARGVAAVYLAVDDGREVKLRIAAVQADVLHIFHA